MPGDFDATISPENKAKLNYYISSILKSLDEQNYHATLLSLMVLQQFVSDNLRPESLSPEFVDFAMDQEMWGWVEKAAGKKEFNDYDLEALDIIGAELRELLQRDNVVEKIKEAV